MTERDYADLVSDLREHSGLFIRDDGTFMVDILNIETEGTFAEAGGTVAFTVLADELGGPTPQEGVQSVACTGARGFRVTFRSAEEGFTVHLLFAPWEEVAAAEAKQTGPAPETHSPVVGLWRGYMSVADDDNDDEFGDLDSFHEHTEMEVRSNGSFAVRVGGGEYTGKWHDSDGAVTIGTIDPAHPPGSSNITSVEHDDGTFVVDYTDREHGFSVSVFFKSEATLAEE